MNQKLKSLIFIVLLGSISTGLLLGMRAYTAPIIERNEEVVLRSSVLKAAGIPFDRETMDEIFEREIVSKNLRGQEYFMSPRGDYIFQYVGRGLWGLIEGIVAVKPDMKTIANLQVTSQEETPGLGARIVEVEFLGQFDGKVMDPDLKLTKRKGSTASDTIEAITGATITSQALVDTVNDSVDDFRKRMDE